MKILGINSTFTMFGDKFKVVGITKVGILYTVGGHKRQYSATFPLVEDWLNNKEMKITHV